MTSSLCAHPRHSSLCAVQLDFANVTASKYTMPRWCIFPQCSHKMTVWTTYSFHRLPLRNLELLKLWLVALKMDPDTPVDALKRADHRVCSAHFAPDDFLQKKVKKEGQKVQRRKLKKNAIPVVSEGTTDAMELQDIWGVMDRPPGQVGSIDIQVNVSKICTATKEKPTLQHIVDEEAILQLMKNCPMCNRKCRCSKRPCGPYLIVYQSCYFCHYQRKWASQPEARNMNIYKAHTPTKRKRKLKDKASINAKAQSSQLKKSSILESSVSESHEPLQT